MDAPAAVGETGDTGVLRINRLVELLIQHDRAFTAYKALEARVTRVREQTGVLHAETAAMRARRATDAEERTQLREAIQAEVRQLVAQALPPEKIVIAIKHLLRTAVEAGGLHERTDFLRDDVFQWMLHAMYAA